ncbi:MAG TPA: cupin domain-containing protein [Flavipsychrobacter sp.]|nr:cupin domain-containing protein [Flavipsychrobacter sp.]
MENKAIHFNGGFDVEFLSETPELNTFKCIVKPEARTPMPHYHEKFDEMVKSLVGTTTVVIDGKTSELTSGESVIIRRGSVHQIGNRTGQTIEFLCEVTPGVFGYKYFRDIEPILNADGLPDIERFKEVMRSHGLVPVINFKQSLIFGILRLIRLFKK